MKRNRITFFASYYEALRELPSDERVALYDGIMLLAFEGKEPHFESPIARSIWAAIRPNIQSTINKSNAGMMGGAKIGNQNARKSPYSESIDFEEINPQKNKQKSNKNQTEINQKTSNKDKDKGIKEKDKDKKKDIQDNNSNESLSIVDITSNEVCQIWNEICAPVGLQRVMKMTTRRQEKARCRLREWQAGGADARNTFREICNAIASSSFCRGQNSHKWEATFDWIIENDSNYVKVMEGKYNDKQTTNDYGSRHLNERAAENEFWRQQHELARSIVAGGGNPATIPDD